MTTPNSFSRSSHDLLAELRREGLRLSEERGGLRVAPKSALTTDLRDILVDHKDELLAALSLEARLLWMPLSQFERQGRPVEVRVAGLDATLWFVPGTSEVDNLVLRGISRGRIWTARELRALWGGRSVTQNDVQSLARIKMTLDAEVVSIEAVHSA